MPLVLKAAGRTDVGLVRPGNEDFLYLDDKHHLYVVCDGMGGHQAGEVASMSAVEMIETCHHNFADELLADARLEIGKPVPDTVDLLLRAVRLANRDIYLKSAENTSMSGMGTTVVAVTFEHDLVGVVHVGDSRAYRLDKKQLVPLTEDHSWVSEMQATHNISQREAESLVGKNVITRALGVRDTVEVDCRLVRIKPGDTLILCSDGLCGFADDDEIFDVANRVRDDLDKIVDSLIQLANDRGGNDNVTVIAIRVEEATETDIPEVKVFTVASESPELLTVEDEWIAKIREHQSEQNASPKRAVKKKAGVNRFLLVLIFAAFAVIAWLIIYLLGAQ